MKKLLLAALTFLAALTLSAQEYSTSWPYLYPQFTEGTIFLTNGTKLVHQVNVHILHGRLHYIDNGVVKEALSKDILLIKIGDDEYMNVNGDIMRVVAKEPRGLIAALQLGDFDKLNETGGAYGSSTTSSATRKLTSIDVAGKVNQNHMELWEGRHSGEAVDLDTSYFVVTPGKTLPATRKGITADMDKEEKAAFQKWLKTHKIKWKDPQSLLQLVDFLNAE